MDTAKHLLALLATDKTYPYDDQRVASSNMDINRTDLENLFRAMICDTLPTSKEQLFCYPSLVDCLSDLWCATVMKQSQSMRMGSAVFALYLISYYQPNDNNESTSKSLALFRLFRSSMSIYRKEKENELMMKDVDSFLEKKTGVSIQKDESSMNQNDKNKKSNTINLSDCPKQQFVRVLIRAIVADEFCDIFSRMWYARLSDLSTYHIQYMASNVTSQMDGHEQRFIQYIDFYEYIKYTAFHCIMVQCTNLDVNDLLLLTFSTDQNNTFCRSMSPEVVKYFPRLKIRPSPTSAIQLAAMFEINPNIAAFVQSDCRRILHRLIGSTANQKKMIDLLNILIRYCQKCNKMAEITAHLVVFVGVISGLTEREFDTQNSFLSVEVKVANQLKNNTSIEKMRACLSVLAIKKNSNLGPSFGKWVYSPGERRPIFIFPIIEPHDGVLLSTNFSMFRSVVGNRSLVGSREYSMMCDFAANNIQRIDAKRVADVNGNGPPPLPVIEIIETLRSHFRIRGSPMYASVAHGCAIVRSDLSSSYITFQNNSMLFDNVNQLGIIRFAKLVVDDLKKNIDTKNNNPPSARFTMLASGIHPEISIHQISLSGVNNDNRTDENVAYGKMTLDEVDTFRTFVKPYLARLEKEKLPNMNGQALLGCCERHRNTAVKGVRGGRCGLTPPTIYKTIEIPAPKNNNNNNREKYNTLFQKVLDRTDCSEKIASSRNDSEKVQFERITRSADALEKKTTCRSKEESDPAQLTAFLLSENERSTVLQFPMQGKSESSSQRIIMCYIIDMVSRASFYYGTIKDRKFDGFGTLKTVSGYIYIGGWKNGKRHGVGVEVLPYSPNSSTGDDQVLYVCYDNDRPIRSKFTTLNRVDRLPVFIEMIAAIKTCFVQDSAMESSAQIDPKMWERCQDLVDTYLTFSNICILNMQEHSVLLKVIIRLLMVECDQFISHRFRICTNTIGKQSLGKPSTAVDAEPNDTSNWITSIKNLPSFLYDRSRDLFILCDLIDCVYQSSIKSNHDKKNRNATSEEESNEEDSLSGRFEVHSVAEQKTSLDDLDGNSNRIKRLLTCVLQLALDYDQLHNNIGWNNNNNNNNNNNKLSTPTPLFTPKPMTLSELNMERVRLNSEKAYTLAEIAQTKARSSRLRADAVRIYVNGVLTHVAHVQEYSDVVKQRASTVKIIAKHVQLKCEITQKKAEFARLMAETTLLRMKTASLELVRLGAAATISGTSKLNKPEKGHKCHYCWKNFTLLSSVLRCPCTDKPLYCSVACQQRDWKIGGHRNKCSARRIPTKPFDISDSVILHSPFSVTIPMISSSSFAFVH